MFPGLARQCAAILATALIYLVIIALVDAALFAHKSDPRAYKINFEYKVF